jgi:hypothetical protein
MNISPSSISFTFDSAIASKMSTGVGMSDCCLSGKVHEGTPTGKIETINSLKTYVAAPKGGSKAKSIVFLVDSKL